MTLLLALAAGAAESGRVDFTARDGRQFNNVIAKRVAGRTLAAISDESAQLLNFTNLPEDIQKRFFEPSMLHPPQVDDMLEFKTTDGHEFKGKLTNIAPNGISLQTTDGVVKVPYGKLPTELVNTFDWDPAAAARYEAGQQKAFETRQAVELQSQKVITPKPGARSSSSSKKTTPNPALGASGRKKLGTPKLSGSGLGN